MGHGEGKELPEVYNLAVKKTHQYPFSGKLVRTSKSPKQASKTLRVTVPADYVRNLRLQEGEEYQFYIEVAA